MQRNFNPRRLWRYYLAALLLVATMATTKYVTGRVAAAALDKSAAAIDISGRQRMLSQRIAFFANAYVNAENAVAMDAARRDLEESLTLFEQSHARLTDPSTAAAVVRTLPPLVRDVYFRDERGVDAVAQKYVSVGAALLASDGEQARLYYKEIELLGLHVMLPLLDEAVQAFEKDADEKVAGIERNGDYAYLAMLVVLLLEGVFIFWPAHKNVVRAFDDAKAARRETSAALKEAEQASRLKSEFLANMSHEIRTPLNGVLGVAQLLARTDLTDQQRELTATIESSGRALLAIINDVLDLAKIEAGLVALEDEPFDLAGLLQRTRDAVYGVAATKGVRLSIEIDEALSTHYLGDQKHILQILINLAGNAVKFSDDGMVRICAALAEDDAVLFSVADEGPGIELAQQKLIFERFAQADATAVRKHGGTGLGLAISKELVDMMGGEIGLESTLGHGARFWFELPLTPVCVSQSAPTVTKWADGASARMIGDDNDAEYSILLAEDNHANRMVISKLLTSYSNVALTVVENGQAALEALDDGAFDLVLLDINMPIMCGSEAMRRIRSTDASYSDVPIIVMTANTSKEQQDQYLNEGATAYVAKPIDLEAFETLLWGILLSEPGEQSLQESA